MLYYCVLSPKIDHILKSLIMVWPTFFLGLPLSPSVELPPLWSTFLTGASASLLNILEALSNEKWKQATNMEILKNIIIRDATKEN
jgi:hypothetical protein